MTSRTWRSQLGYWGGLAAIWMTVGLFGCNSEEPVPSRRIIVQNPQRARPAQPVAPLPVADTTTVVREQTESVGETTVVTEPVHPEVSRQVTYEEAEAAFQDKDYAKARILFTAYTERKPENPWGCYMLGLSAWKSGHLDEAEVAFERALEMDSQHVKSYINLSRVRLEGGRPSEALVAVAHALEIDPESNAAYRVQGRVFHELGQNEEAVRSYRQAIVIDSHDAWAMNNLGLILVEEDRCEEALLPLARAVELSSDVAVFQNNLGMALERTGRYRMAEESYRSAVALDGSYEKAALNLGRIEAVRELRNVEPVDLAELAQRFSADIEARRVAVTEIEHPRRDIAVTGSRETLPAGVGFDLPETNHVEPDSTGPNLQP